MTISAGAGAQTITEHELAQAELFEENGYVALTPGGPDDPDTVEDAKAHCQTLHRGAVNNSRSRGTPARSAPATW